MTMLRRITTILGILSSAPAKGVVSAITSLGSVVAINDVQYFIPPSQIAQIASACPSLLKCSGSSGPIVGATVLDTTSPSYGFVDLNTTIASFVREDDVFQPGFLQALIVRTDNLSLSQNLELPLSVQCACFTTGSTRASIPQGPYFLSTQTGALYTPYRLYVDSQEAFTLGVMPSTQGGFQALPAAIEASSSPTIGVPSRLYYQKTAQKPLPGVRLGVKDLYDLQGLKTGAGSRAYYDVYGPANKTAPAVQRLIDAGAIVVGKMKTTQFAAPEFASLAVDYQAPFNARADGYQEPGSSSSGPGAGMSSYPWLDIALGSDTGGSVRVPAHENGLYGNRPSHGHVTLDNVFPLGPVFDTAGFLARDPQLWNQACRILYSGFRTNYTKYPARIQTFGLSPPSETSPSPASALITSFVRALSDYLSATVTPLNFTQIWADSPPSGTNTSLSIYLNTTWEALTAQPQIQLVRQPLFAKYAAKYRGREPYVNPSTRGAWAWALAENPSVDAAMVQKTTFMQWWNSRILASDNVSCSDSLVLYVGKNALGVTGQPSYRDTQIPGIGIVNGLLNGLFISPLSEVPDFVVPIGEVAYNSTVTGRQEQPPVTIDLMAARGCDLMLLDLILDLQKAGVLSTVKTGTSSIDGGPIYL